MRVMHHVRISDYGHEINDKFKFLSLVIGVNAIVTLAVATVSVSVVMASSITKCCRGRIRLALESLTSLGIATR